MADSRKPAMENADSQRAGHGERRLQEAGRDRTHQNYAHITVTRRGVATVRPTTPESRGRHGHRTPYGSAISRPARPCSHAGLNVIRDRRQYGPRAAGPFSQREARRRPGLPPSAKGDLSLAPSPFLSRPAPLPRALGKEGRAVEQRPSSPPSECRCSLSP